VRCDNSKGMYIRSTPNPYQLWIFCYLQVPDPITELVEDNALRELAGGPEESVFDTTQLTNSKSTKKHKTTCQLEGGPAASVCAMCAPPLASSAAC